MLLRQDLILTRVGMAVGGVAAFSLVRLNQSLLFGVQPIDPLLVAVTALLLGLAVVLACSIPARRAIAHRSGDCFGKVASGRPRSASMNQPE